MDEATDDSIPGLPGRRRERRPQLMICQSCPRYQPSPGRAPGDGATLGKRVFAQLALLPFTENLVAAPISCLGGCRSPCNLSLSTPRGGRLRLTRLAVDDADAVVAAVTLYLTADERGVQIRDLPESLRDKVLSAAPALNLQTTPLREDLLLKRNQGSKADG